MSYDTITAPIDGRVGMITIKTGNSIKANDVPLLTINQVKPIYVAFSVPQAELPGIREAMAQRRRCRCTRLPAGDSGAPVDGKLAFFDNTIDTDFRHHRGARRCSTTRRSGCGRASSSTSP